MIGLILIVVLAGHWEMWAGLHVKITFSICTGYDVIIVCIYVIATTIVRMRTNLAGLIVALAA